MKYIITGSLGNISRPVVEKIVEAGHDVTVITSSENKKNEIESHGAKAAIGSVTDNEFVRNAFKGAEVAYLMVPPNFIVEDFSAYQREVADNYVDAVRANETKHIVLLSSIGAHLRKGAGPIDGLAYLEEQLEKLNVNVKMLRPGYFYYNFHTMHGLIEQARIMGSNFGGGEEKMALTHPRDIAGVAAKHLLDLDFSGNSTEYIVSDLRHSDDIAQVLSASIDKQVPWITFSDEDALQGMLQAGLNKSLAENYVAMGKAFREGRAQEDFFKSNSPLRGKTKLEDFAGEFASQHTTANV